MLLSKLSLVPRPQTNTIPSLIPRPSPKSGKRVWCSERHFLSHGVGPYFIKNVITAFSNPELEFLTSQVHMDYTTQPGLQNLEIAAESIHYNNYTGQNCHEMSMESSVMVFFMGHKIPMTIALLYLSYESVNYEKPIISFLLV